MHSQPAVRGDVGARALESRLSVGFLLACAVLALATALAPPVAPGLHAQDAAPGKKSLRDRKKERESDKKKDEVIRFSGLISNTDPVDKYRGCFHKVHEVKLKPGKTYVIDLMSRGAIGLDLYLRVETSKGERILRSTGGFVEDDDSGSNRNARLAFTPPVEDNYRIIATTFASGQVGGYTLTITPVPLGTPMPLGEQVVTVLAPVELGDIVLTPHPAWGVSQLDSNEATRGYIEYRVTVENYSETVGHQVRIRMPLNRGVRYMMGHFVQSLEKTVQVGPQEVVEVSLFQPDLPMANANHAAVFIDGREQEAGVPMQVASNRGSLSNTFMSGRMIMSRTPGAATMTRVLTGAGLGALDSNVFKSAVGVHEAQLPGVSSTIGGEYPVPGPYHRKRYVYSMTNRFFQPNIPIGDWSTHWLGYTSYDAVAVTGQQLQSAPEEVRRAIWKFTESGGTLLLVGSCKLPEGWEKTRSDGKDFQSYYPGFGQCIVTGDFPVDQWDPDAWREVTGAWSATGKAMEQMATATDAHRQFPVVDNLGIPVRGLFIFMLLFALIIGPLNFYWLTRVRRRMWMIWTIPVASFATCVILFGYMMFSEGWHGHARSTSVTVLDETSQRAATIGWVGYYSPTFVGSGLHFSDDTELTPHLLSDRTYRRSSHPRSLDWTNGQHLEGGWIDAKVPAHFLLRRNEKRLERMLVRRQGDGTPALVNGLPSDLKSVWMATLDGSVWTATDVGAGAEARMQPFEGRLSVQLNALRDGFTRNWLGLAAAMEKNPEKYLRPGCYLAVVEDAPFLEPGMEQTQSRQARSIIYGILKEPL